MHVIIVTSRIIAVGEVDEDAKTKIGKVLVLYIRSLKGNGCRRKIRLRPIGITLTARWG